MQEHAKASAVDVMCMRVNNSGAFSIDSSILNGTSPAEYIQGYFAETGINIVKAFAEKQGPYTVVYAFGPEKTQTPGTNGKQLHF